MRFEGTTPMPIKIPNDLPAAEKLAAEGVRIIDEHEALRQDIRPMQIALLNLMPEKPKTETQLARLLGATPLQVELTLLTTSTYRPNNVPTSHLQSFYRTWEDVADQRFDGLIVTGAPVELMPFHEVKYWPELTRIFDWSRTNVHSSFHICWGAQAALHHFHGVPKHILPAKRFEVYTHYVIERRMPPDRVCCAASTTISWCRCRATPRCGWTTSRTIPGSRFWRFPMPPVSACCRTERTASSTCSTT